MVSEVQNPLGILPAKDKSVRQRIVAIFFYTLLKKRATNDTLKTLGNSTRPDPEAQTSLI